jgi:hypothetical protein
MTTMLEDLAAAIRDIPMPDRIKSLPRDRRGFPVPYFVEKIDGQWDFRVMRKDALMAGISKGSCWLCGQKLGRYRVFVLGPMCTVNRISAEPPSHADCATYAACACPFLTKPRMRYNTKDLPANGTNVEGFVDRNPGATALWVTDQGYRYNPNIRLFEFGDPVRVEWWSKGRRATPEEAREAFDSGVTVFEGLLPKESDPAAARVELDRLIKRARAYLP